MLCCLYVIIVPILAPVKKKRSLLYRNAGYWYVSTLLDQTVKSTMANSSVTRKAFITGNKLPPDDTVRVINLTVKSRNDYESSAD